MSSRCTSSPVGKKLLLPLYSELVWPKIIHLINYFFPDSIGKKEVVDFANYRNQLLNVLIVCPNLCKMAEKNNSEMCHQFLEVFQKCETKSKKGDGLLAFLKMFSKFSNLKSMSSFEKVKHLAQNGLGHLQDKIRETAVGFFTAAYKELRAHKVKSNYDYILF